MYLSFPMPSVVIIIWLNSPVSVFTSRPQAPREQGPHLLLYTTSSPGPPDVGPAHPVIRNSLRMSQYTSRDSTQECQAGMLLYTSIVDLVFNSMTHGSLFPVHQSHLNDLRSALFHFPLACSAHEGIIRKNAHHFLFTLPCLTCSTLRNHDLHAKNDNKPLIYNEMFVLATAIWL